VEPGIFEQELERIFRRGWLFVGHESEVPEATRREIEALLYLEARLQSSRANPSGWRGGTCSPATIVGHRLSKGATAGACVRPG
jgi:hypothetical protein